MEQLVQYFIEDKAIESFNIKTKRVTYDGGRKAILANFIEKEVITSIEELEQDWFLPFFKSIKANSKEFMREFKEAFEEIYLKKEKEVSDKEANEKLKNNPFYREDFEIIKAMNKEDTYYVYDKGLDRTTEIDPSSYMDEMERYGIELDYKPCFVHYNPLDSKRFYEVKDELGRVFPHFNSYSAPKWLKRPRVDNPKPPKEFLDYIGILFPGKESKLAAIGWLRNAIINRCETFLVMNGPKGVGKGIFGDELVRVLVGNANWNKAGSGFLTKEFNSALENGRILHIDEFGADNRKVSAKLKNYINKRVNIERKGKDDYTIEHYTSFIISSNDLADIQIHNDDRRFSVVEVNREPEALKHRWGSEKIHDFIKMLDSDEEAVYQIGNWVLKEGDIAPYNDINYIHKGEHFWKLVKSTLTQWQRMLIEALHEHQKLIHEVGVVDAGIFDWKKVKKAFGRSKLAPSEWLKIEEFIKNHYDEEGNHPATLKKLEGVKFLHPNKRYMELWGDLERDKNEVRDLSELEEDEDLFA